ncbi:MAG: hypothetical protein WA734_12655 [Candidatus Acidiferrales bacterium]
MPPEVSALEKEGLKLFPNIETLNKWRGSTAHLKVMNDEAGFELGGKLDEVLVEKNGRLVPTDFKSSGHESRFLHGGLKCKARFSTSFQNT